VQERVYVFEDVALLKQYNRFYDIAWSKPTADHSEGIIAGALENGSLDLWDVAKFKTNASYVELV
jgi:protein transport protein SEC31